MTEKRTYEDIEDDVKKCRDEIANFENVQFDAQKLSEDVDEDTSDYGYIVDNWSYFMDKQPAGTSVLEDAQQMGEHLRGQGNLLVEDSLNSVAVKIEGVNQKIETYGAELKQLREEEE